jgi:hypothetical protein
MSDYKYIPCVDTAKILRQLLKQTFPGIKFSVRSHEYAGGASINIDWVDGPTQDEVRKISDKFKGAKFDGMIDLKSLKEHNWNGESVHFGADYIFCNRSYSDEFLRELLPVLEKSIDRVEQQRPLHIKPTEMNLEDLRNGKYNDTYLNFVCTEHLDKNGFKITGAYVPIWTMIYKIAENISKCKPQYPKPETLPVTTRVY